MLTYREEEYPQLHGSYPSNGGRMEMAQLMRGIPRLEGPERVHLPERAEECEECTEDSQPSGRSAIGEIGSCLGQGLDISRGLREDGLAGNRTVARGLPEG